MKKGIDQQVIKELIESFQIIAGHVKKMQDLATEIDELDKRFAALLATTE